MADESKKTEAPKASRRVGIRLVPTGRSDLPLLANVARGQMSAAAVLVDFGFLEPAPLAALARRARAGEKMPEAMNGRLIARIALSSEALLALHQQLGQILRTPRRGNDDTKAAL